MPLRVPVTSNQGSKIGFVGRRDGVSLRVGYEGPGSEGPDGPVDAVDGAAILGDGVLHAFAVNRSPATGVDLTIELAGADLENGTVEVLQHDDPEASNTWDRPDTVRREKAEISSADGALMIRLDPMAFVAVTAEVG